MWLLLFMTESKELINEPIPRVTTETQETYFKAGAVYDCARVCQLLFIRSLKTVNEPATDSLFENIRILTLWITHV